MIEILAHTLFWGSLLLIGWTYVGYGVWLAIIAAVRPRQVDKQDIEPPVTLVVTAWNEERRIRRKIENSLSLDYPKDKFTVIVVSDGSTDATDDIVREYGDRGVKLVRIPQRTGKHYGQRHGIEAADTDLIILSDATTFLEEQAVRKIVRNFADPSVGVVSGEDQIDSDGGDVSGEGAYVKYEMLLRTFEAKASSLIGASGCFFAIRKQLAQKCWIDNMSSDFFMPLVARMNGYRTVDEPEAIGYYRVVADPSKEFIRKVRTVVHGLEVLFRFSPIMNVFRYGLFAIQVISHKLMRWLVPLAMLLLIVGNLMLLSHGLFYQVVMAAQAVGYGVALISWLVKPLQRIIMFKLPFFFVMVNLSIAVAWIDYLRGKEYVVWEATKR